MCAKQTTSPFSSTLHRWGWSRAVRKQTLTAWNGVIASRLTASLPARLSPSAGVAKPQRRLMATPRIEPELESRTQLFRFQIDRSQPE